MLLFRAGCLAVPARWRITCLDSRSPAGGRICPQHGAIRRIFIFQSGPDSRERNKWSEATWFRESARTEHRSEGEAAAKERSGYLLLGEVTPACYRSRILIFLTVMTTNFPDNSERGLSRSLSRIGMISP